jgi:farnesyl diphosphate synthase
MSFAERVAEYRDRVESALEGWLPPAATHPARFHSALRYSVLGGGRRLRPLLVYATGEWLGLPASRLDPIAVAIEFVHAYSLVHDDLPARHDNALRRGRAATHVAFDQATAILVGDALQAHVYRVLATDPALAVPPEVRRQLVVDLARASGSEGMAGGQAMDLAVTGTPAASAKLEEVHARETSSLLCAAVLMPCRLRGDLERARLEAAGRVARALGLAFQLADDILDLQSTADLRGKPLGSDVRNHRATLPALADVDASRRRLGELRDEIDATLVELGGTTDGLRLIGDWINRRDF